MNARPVVADADLDLVLQQFLDFLFEKPADDVRTLIIPLLQRSEIVGAELGGADKANRPSAPHKVPDCVSKHKKDARAEIAHRTVIRACLRETRLEKAMGHVGLAGPIFRVEI